MAENGTSIDLPSEFGQSVPVIDKSIEVQEPFGGIAACCR